jgi:hypothetical protein
VRKETRAKVAKDLTINKSNKHILGFRRNIRKEELPSVESMNRLSTLNEQEEIEYEDLGSQRSVLETPVF